jgi:YhcH/YjgK/YiaL family protein
MIVVKLNDKNLSGYANVHPRFEAAFAALKDFVTNERENGRYEIDGDNIFVMVQSYTPKMMSAETKFETHRDYIDIQYMLKNGEKMCYQREEEMTAVSEYKPDVQFFAQTESFDTLYIDEGELAIFFPEEAHAPGLAQSEDQPGVKKIIVKVRV